MKKINLLAILMLGVCGSMASSYADDEATDATSSMVAPLTSDEAVFAAQLIDSNKAAFMAMPSDVRADCMKMSQEADANGMSLTPDQAVEKMSSMMAGSAVSCATE